MPPSAPESIFRWDNPPIRMILQVPLPPYPLTPLSPYKNILLKTLTPFTPSRCWSNRRAACWRCSSIAVRWAMAPAWSWRAYWRATAAAGRGERVGWVSTIIGNARSYRRIFWPLLKFWIYNRKCMYIYIEREGLRVRYPILDPFRPKPLLKVMFWYVVRRTKTRPAGQLDFPARTQGEAAKNLSLLPMAPSRRQMESIC